MSSATKLAAALNRFHKKFCEGKHADGSPVDPTADVHVPGLVWNAWHELAREIFRETKGFRTTSRKLEKVVSGTAVVRRRAALPEGSR